MSNNRIKKAVDNLKQVVKEETGIEPSDIKVYSHGEEGLNNMFTKSNNLARNYRSRRRRMFKADTYVSETSIGMSVRTEGADFTIFGEP